MPAITPTDVAPQDCLHLFADGLLRSEGAWLHYVLAKLGLKCGTVNAAIRAYKGLPPDVRIPPIHAKIERGRTGGTPNRHSVLRMTGSQVMHYSLHR